MPDGPRRPRVWACPRCGWTMDIHGKGSHLRRHEREAVPPAAGGLEGSFAGRRPGQGAERPR